MHVVPKGEEGKKWGREEEVKANGDAFGIWVTRSPNPQKEIQEKKKRYYEIATNSTFELVR